MSQKMLYVELTPQEFRERLAVAPIAYLPLGALEWHGDHLPLGADGLQAQGFFCHLAEIVGGIVLPMLFVGPDLAQVKNGQELYGMDLSPVTRDEQKYEVQQLDGSAYWVPDETFKLILDGILKQLRRVGFRIVVGHGHFPSTKLFRDHAQEWKENFDLDCYTCLDGDLDEQGLGIQVDHAAMNETSLMMALHPDLVQMGRLPADLDQWPLGIGGKDPRLYASADLGWKAIKLQAERMAGVLGKALNSL